VVFISGIAEELMDYITSLGYAPIATTPDNLIEFNDFIYQRIVPLSVVISIIY